MVFETIEKLVSFAQGAKLPEWQRKLFAKNRERVQVHSKGRLFYKLDTLFPNEHPSSKAHRMMAFEPITESSFLKGRNNVGRIFKNSSYTAEASETTIEYITDDRFCDKNLFTFLLDLFVEVALSDDPNAPFVFYPSQFIEATEQDPVVAISTEHVLHWDHNSIIFKSVADSDVEYKTDFVAARDLYCFDKKEISKYKLSEAFNNSYSERVKTIFTRTTYHCFIDDKFYRLEQKKTGGFEVTEYTLNNTKLPPVIAGGGIVDEHKSVFKSFLYPFVPFGNLALFQHSQHTAVNMMFSFPRMSEIETPCDKCLNGRVACPISELYPEGKMDCGTCGGSGWTTPQSVYKIYKRRPDFGGVDPESTKALLEADDVKFYTPDVSILDYSKNEWRGYLNDAEEAIFVPQQTDTGNVQSFKSKEKDYEQMYAWLMTVAARFYHVLKFGIQQIENDQNENPMPVDVQEPFSYAILSEYEAFEALDTILKSDAPDFIKGNEVQTFVSKFLSASSPIKKMFKVLTAVDLLLLKTSAELQTLKSNAIITPDQWATHTFAFPVLSSMYQEDKTLFTQEASVIEDKLRKQLVQYMPLGSDLKTELLNGVEGENGGGGVIP